MFVVKEFREVVTPKSAQEGDLDHDLSGENGVHNFNSLEEIVKFLRDKNTSASSSHFHPDLWYTTRDEEEDYSSGNRTTYSFFLDDNLSDEQKYEIFMKLTPSAVAKISKRDLTKISTLSKRDAGADFIHCPVCGRESLALGSLGRMIKYRCRHCDYGFSNAKNQ